MKPLKSLAIAVGGLCALPAAAHGKDNSVPNTDASGMAMMRLNASVLQENTAAAKKHTAKADTAAQRIYGGSVWKQLAHDFRLNEVNSGLVRSHENKFAANSAYFTRTLDRSKPYMFHITNEVKKRGMPAEIALLPFIESAYVTKARSHVGASGLWQFMPATGRHYGLEQTPLYDGRHDVYASTNAALNYLQYLHGLFGDWSLALAAYNWGEGNLTRAIRRAQSAGLPPTYENLRMPSETRNYVPKLLAVRNLVMNPQNYGLQLPEIQHSPYFKAVSVDTPMDIMAAAHLANIPENEFLALNPGFKTPVFIPKNGRKMLLPVTAVNTFESNYRNSDARSLLSWDVYTPDYTTTLSDIAAKTNTPVGELRRLNGINGNRVSAGKSILVSRNNTLNNQQNINFNFAKADNDPVPDTYVEQAPVLTAADTAPPAAPAVAAATPAPQPQQQKQANFINFVENGAVNEPAAETVFAAAASEPAVGRSFEAAVEAVNRFEDPIRAFSAKEPSSPTHNVSAKNFADKAVQAAGEHFAFADVTRGASEAAAPVSDNITASAPAAVADDPLMNLAKQRAQALQAARSTVAQANAQAERAEAARIAKEVARAKARAAAERAAKVAEAKEAKRREQERLRAERLQQAKQLAHVRQAREAGQSVPQAIRASAQIQAYSGTHKVSEGDTLYNIAKRYNMNVADLASANGIRNNSIRIGQVLRINGTKKPATQRSNPLSKVSGNSHDYAAPRSTPASHTVRKGDTLYSIAARYKMNVNDIKRLNKGVSNLKTGQTIKLISS
ncbi:LysM peptidoglycan-binding domain-containing protein [Conchiformibius steedae]|uniref:LysM peptidoglycan-binding domain-containing protein n=2 Tax=Conchiformibius steedae TaxID=153493 RepID=A0A3P2A7D7_9NEIS|nr:LysM peptidoglycan-binding domain-containing protein [Conchiformibius steedae]